MKMLKNNLNPILVALAQLVVGIILLSKPEGLTTLVITVVGVLLMLSGLGLHHSLAKYAGGGTPVFVLRTAT